MALSRELLKRLNTEEYPLPKRLKLAETVFSSMNLPLIQKEDLLLEWLCKICSTNQYAWKTLNNCLKSAHIDIKTNIKQCLIDALEITLNSNIEDAYNEVLECCSLVLANNSMQQYFGSKVKSLGSLIKALLNNVLRHSNCPNVSSNELDVLLKTHREITSIQSDTIISITESLMQIYKISISMRNELRLIFIHDILYPMCNLIDHRYIDNTNKFGMVAYKCIQLLLLGKSKSAQEKQIMESSSDLFCMLSKNVETLDLQSNLLTYQFIFRIVINSHKSNAVLLDKFFRNLINSAGRYKWEILYACLKLLNDVMLDFDNAIDDVMLSEYFQKFISDILTYNMKCMQYGVLIQIAYINPLLIEKNIPNILNKILMDEQTTDYTNLLIAILHTSTKLRREQKFIAQLLISFKQHIAMTKTYKINASAFFPHEFKIKLVKIIGNLSNAQTVAILKTLIYYLNTDCVELLQCDTSCKNVLILKATVELLVMLFEGIQIFEYTRTLPAHEKFINALDELGDALSQLINKSLCLTHNKNVTIILLSAVLSLSEIQNMLKYYVPKDAITRKLSFPILDDPWQQLIQRITNFGEDNCKIIMNKLILHRIKLNVPTKSIKLNGLIGGIEYSWSIILQHDLNVLSLLRDKDVSKVTSLLLADMTSSTNNFRKWLYILDKECLQENKYFMMCLSSHILVHIGQCLPLENTKCIIENINAKLLMENNENNKLLEVLQVMKELICQEQWIQTTNDISSKIQLHLEILSLLPTMYFGSHIRTLIFLIVYCISKKCEANNTILTLCNTIFSELLEKPGIDIFQYIEPTMLIKQLMRNKVFSKACEFSFRNIKTYDTLKSLIKSCAQCKETMCILLECMISVKSKLDTEQKAIFKKAEKKLAKTILKLLPDEVNDILDIRCLIVVLKVITLTGKISDSLKKLTELTLKNVFITKKDSSDMSNNTLLHSMQLAVIVLRYRKTFEVEDAIIKNLWVVMLKHPHKNLLELLLASTGLKEFYELLKMLHDKTINSLSQTDETMWTNLFVIWKGIMKVDMNAKRNKMRLTALNNMLEIIELLDIPDKYWSDLLDLSHYIIATKHLLISDNMIDLIMTISLKSLNKVKISSCENVLAICGTLIKIRTNLITDRLPVLLLLYRGAINVVVHASKSMVDKFDEHRFRRLALDIEKLTGLLIKLKKDMVRLSPYLIADLLQLIVESAVPSYIKMALQNILCQLIGISDQHGIAFLSRALPMSLQEVFKIQLNMFNKFYKYSGKI